MTPDHLSDVTGWWSEITGIVGSLLLVVPLFYLLRSREAVEDLDDDEGLDEETKKEIAASRSLLSDRIRRGRPVVFWTGIAGVVLLLAALVLAIVQAGYKDWHLVH
jgi:hypothetical protein